MSDSTSTAPAAVSDTDLLKALASLFSDESDGSLHWAIEQGNDIFKVLAPEHAAALKAFRTRHNRTNDLFT